MRPPGLAEVGAAKADGREAAFESLGGSERYAVILMAEFATSGQAP